MKITAILLTLITIWSGPAVSQAHQGEENLNELKKHLTDYICGNDAYMACIGVSYEQCRSLFSSAFNSCELKYINGIEMPIPDPVCITNKWTDAIPVTVEAENKCSDHLDIPTRDEGVLRRRNNG